jgi:CheY-like chemotaxis protein
VEPGKETTGKEIPETQREGRGGGIFGKETNPMTAALHSSLANMGSRTMVRCDGDLDPVTRADIRRGILLVEDEVLVRMMIADAFRDAGYTVIEAANAHEALEVLRHNSIDVRAILSDIRMPGRIDGVGLARTVRSHYPAIRVVLTSGHLAALDWADHDGFFAKPYDADALVRHINSLLD